MWYFFIIFFELHVFQLFQSIYRYKLKGKAVEIIENLIIVTLY